MNDIKMAIQVRDLSLVIKKKTILNSVNIDLKEGECIGIIGENGSGKSMLLKVISGLILPTAGSVKVWGESLSMVKSFSKDTGILIEHPGILPNKTGYKNLLFLAEIKKKTTKDDIYRLMKDFGLNPKDKMHVSKYSLGMKQKLGIIQAIMEKPQLLLLDEPMSNLDNESKNMIRSLFLKMKNDDKNSFIITSHDKEDISTLCSKVYKIKNGELFNDREII